MGRPNKSKKRQGGSNEKQAKHRRPKKKQKRERFWIEDCRDTSATSNIKGASLEVLITQVQLFDDYRQAPQPQPQPQCDDNKGNENENKGSESGNDNKNKNESNGNENEKNGNENENDKKGIKNKNENDKEQKGNVDTAAVASPQKPHGESNVEIEPKNSSEANSNENTTVSQEGKDANDGVVERNADASGDSNENTTSNDSSGGDFSDAFICIKRSNSAKKPTKVPENCIEVENYKPLPNGDCGDGVINPYDNQEVPDKFWSQRRRLFTLFDKGIRLDKESWYSVTPEAIANHISAHLVSNRENAIVLDPFCGCGGNAIAFARMEEVKLVVCIDKDKEKLKMAASNATVYNIPTNKMVFIHDDATRILSLYENKTISTTAAAAEGNSAMTGDASKDGFRIGGTELLPKAIDCIFLSPPWGGIDYGKVGKRNYTLKCINIEGLEENTQMDGDGILKRAANALGQDGPIALFLPRNINGVALGRSVLKAGYDCPMVLEKNVLNGKLKTVTAYIGL